MSRERSGWSVDEQVRFVPLYDVEGMFYPVACGWCGHVHDAGKVTVTARYLDCSVWRCPSCNVEQDDRPGNARSSARPIR